MTETSDRVAPPAPLLGAPIDLPASTDPNDYLNVSNVLPPALEENYLSPSASQPNQMVHGFDSGSTLEEPVTTWLPGAGTTGAFPDWDDADRPEHHEYPSPLQIAHATDAPGHIPSDVFDNGRDMHKFYTNYPGETRDAGTPAVVYNYQALAALLAAPSGANSRQLYRGAGTLLGYTGISTGAPATGYEFLVDTADNDGNGIVLMIRNTAVPFNAFTTCGNEGLEFRYGLTLVNIAGNSTVLIPIIRRQTHRLK